MTRHRWTPLDDAFLKRHYASTRTSLIAAKWGITSSAVRHRTFRLGLNKERTAFIEEMSVKGRRYSLSVDYFDTLNTDEKAYWLGFIYADGSIDAGESQIRVEISSRDLKHLEALREAIGFSGPIARRDRGTHGISLLQLYSPSIVRALATYGVVPNKSERQPVPRNIPARRIRAFLRGFFDGDGCISRSGGAMWAEFLGGWDVCVWARREISRAIGSRGSIYHKKHLLHRLVFHGKAADALCEWLYTGEGPRLARKEDRWAELAVEARGLKAISGGALPWLVNPTVPQPTDSPGNAPAIFQALATLFIDIFNAPANTAISGHVMDLGTNVDGKVALLPVVKADSPFLRLIGTEPGASDVMIQEQDKVILLSVNTGTEAAPIWQIAWSFRMPVVGFQANFFQANTGNRLYTLPDQSGTIALLSDIAGGAFPAGTVLSFFQAAAPTGWTRVVDAANTDRVARVMTNNEVPGLTGTWFVTGFIASGHRHEAPVGNYTTVGLTGAVENDDAVFPSSGQSRSFRSLQVTADLGDVAVTTVETGSFSPLVVNDGTWRPACRDCILASKD